MCFSPSPESKSHQHRNLVYFVHLEQCLAHSSHPVNPCWIYSWIYEWLPIDFRITYILCLSFRAPRDWVPGCLPDVLNFLLLFLFYLPYLPIGPLNSSNLWPFLTTWWSIPSPWKICSSFLPLFLAQSTPAYSQLHSNIISSPKKTFTHHPLPSNHLRLCAFTALWPSPSQNINSKRAETTSVLFTTNFNTESCV